MQMSNLNPSENNTEEETLLICIPSSLEVPTYKILASPKQRS